MLSSKVRLRIDPSRFSPNAFFSYCPQRTPHCHLQHRRPRIPTFKDRAHSSAANCRPSPGLAECNPLTAYRLLACRWRRSQRRLPSKPGQVGNRRVIITSLTLLLKSWRNCGSSRIRVEGRATTLAALQLFCDMSVGAWSMQLRSISVELHYEISTVMQSKTSISVVKL
jgi:hypothetical protein